MAATELRRGGRAVPLSAQLFRLLSYLVQERGRTVSQPELLRAVWGDVVVSEGTPRQAILELRRRLAEGGPGARDVIKTLRGHGYRFVAPVVQHEPAAEGSLAPGVLDRADAAVAESLGAGSSGPRLSAAPWEPGGGGAPRDRCRETGLAGQTGLWGRAGELLQLRQALAGAVDDSGRAVVLMGPEGVGKSRLAREVLGMARARQALWHEARSPRDGLQPPLWPFVQALRTALEGHDEAIGAATRLACEAAAPWLVRCALGELPAPEDPAWLMAKGELTGDGLGAGGLHRLHLFEALSRALVIASRPRGLVVVFEDLHDADPTSLAFATHLAPLLSQGRILLVTTCRTGETPPTPALAAALTALTQGPHDARIDLANLGPEETRQIVAQVLGAEPPPDLLNDVQTLCQGNPLWARELALAAAVEPARQPGQELEQLPLRAAIQRRLRRLPEATLRTASACAVLGREFGLGACAALCECTPEQALGPVTACLQAGIFESPGHGRFGFAHPLWRELAGAELEPLERCRLHARAGLWLEQATDTESLERHCELARHFCEAAPVGYASQALRYAREAGRRAVQAAAFDVAVHHYDCALRCTELLPERDPAELLDIELERAAAFRATGAPSEDVRAHYAALRARAEQLEHQGAFVRAVLGYTGHHYNAFAPVRFAATVDRDEVAQLERALAWLGPEASELRVLTLCSLAYALAYDADHLRRAALGREALAQAEQLGEPALQARALLFQIFICATPDGLAARLAACDALVELTHQHHLRELELEARVARVTCLYCATDFAGAQRDIDRAAQLAAELGSAQAHARAALPALYEAFLAGQLETARRLTLEAYGACPEDPNVLAIFMIRTASIDLLGGAPVDSTVAVYEDLLHNHPQAVGARAALATAYATLGRTREAERQFDWVARDDFAALPRDLNWLPTMVVLADAAVALDDAVRARLVYDRLLPHAGELFFFAVEAAPGSVVSLWLGELATTMRRHAEALDWLRHAAQVHATMNAPLLDQYWALAQARLLLAQGTPDAGAAVDKLLSGVARFAEAHQVAWLNTYLNNLRQQQARAPRRTRPTA